MASEKLDIKTCCALGRCGVVTNLSACGACGIVAYCSKEHQTEHFKEGGHKMICPGRKAGAPLTFPACYEKATEHFTEKRWRSALPFYSAMLELTERTCGLIHPQIVRVLDAMATCYKKLNKDTEAIECIQRALVLQEIFNDGSSEGNLALFNVTGRLAELYLLSGQIEIGKQLLTKTEEQTKEVFGEASFERGRTLNSLAVAHERAEEFVEAEAKLMEAIGLEGFGQTKDDEKLGIVSDCYFNLGALLCERSRHADALPHLKRCLEMRVRASFPSDHPEIISVNEMIERAKKGSSA